MSNDQNKGPQEHLSQRADIERRDLLLGSTALLTATALSNLANAQTQAPDSIKTRTASCNCGQLRVTTKGPDPDRVVMCNCYLCQKQTGSPFSLQARFPNEQVTIEGKSKAWKFPIEGAKPVTYRTCAGTDGITNSLPMWSRLISALSAGRPFTISEPPIPPAPASKSAPSPTRRFRRRSVPASKSTGIPG